MATVLCCERRVGALPRVDAPRLEHLSGILTIDTPFCINSAHFWNEFAQMISNYLEIGGLCVLVSASPLFLVSIHLDPVLGFTFLIHAFYTHIFSVPMHSHLLIAKAFLLPSLCFPPLCSEAFFDQGFLR